VCSKCSYMTASYAAGDQWARGRLPPAMGRPRMRRQSPCPWFALRGPMTDRLRRRLDAFDATLPLERAHTIPNSWYFDPELYDLERRTVFAGWQAVGRTDQLDRAGAYVTAEVAGEPVAAVRDHDGTLRAFHNVCRHQAAPVLT